jgi:hypothetical protein
MAIFGEARRSPLYRVRQGVSGVMQLDAVARMPLLLSAASLVLTIAACSSSSTQDKSASSQSSAQERLVWDSSRQDRSTQDRSVTYRTTAAHPRPGQTHRADRTLFAQQPAPDCEFKGSELQTVDADQWARLKLDYERHCYEQAEALARKRLQQLLASGKCRVESN